ncbi:MAG: hypothetical protein K2X27_20525 [Candidatus Obscuribacterales bacterium]|nr:hypothetical protein [Candidatus Obscuribacterales bacterium]
MSLSKEPAFSTLRNRFVCGYRDISDQPYCGNSGVHTVTSNAIETTNGAGPHNIQLFVMDPDGTVLHCLPGYWNPQDLVGELDLAERLDSVYRERSLSPEQKRAQFASMHIDHFKHHSKELVARSHMQDFDRKHELSRPFSDTLRSAPNFHAVSWQEGGDDLVKTTDEIMHERMSQRPFFAYNNFDTGRFSDYGTHFYDKHEDSLDENGKRLETESMGKAATMKDGGQRRHGRNAAGGSGHVPHLQIKTYGRLRSMQ